MKLSLTFIFLFTLFCALNGFAQTDSAFLARTINALEKYSSANPVEKVHLHFDKQGYMPGDTIWFKAYVVTGENHSLSSISNVAYVELLTAKDSVLSRMALPLSSGIGWGDIALPVLLKTGKYQLRAYTNWMRNDDPAYFFSQQISIGDLQAIKAKKQNITAKPDVQFFPEGGLLINGLRSKVAIKSVDEKGLGEDLEGLVTDNDDNEVAEFKTRHLGMGVIAITPAASKLYKVKITCKNGNRYTFDLPKAHDEGFAIAINNTQADSLSVRIVASNKLFETQKSAGYYLLAQSAGKICYTAAFRLAAQSFNTVIDKKRFPTGITRFTLFAANGEPLNERVVFIQNNHALKLSVTSAGKTSAARQKVKFSLDAKTADDSYTTGSFSVSVINEDFTPVDELSENTILNNLLLTSDIKGYIEQPNYYFTDITDKTRADLDILMLTQGYRRFEWKQVLADKHQQPVFEAEKSLQISGYVKTLDGKPVPNGKVKLLTTKAGIFMLDTVTNENGKFSFNRLPEDSARYVIQARTDKDKKNVMVVLDTLSGHKSFAFRNAPGEKDTIKELTAYQKQVKQQLKLSLDKRTIQLKEVVIKDKKDTPKDIFSHAEHPDQVINDFPKEPTGESLSTFLGVRLRGIEMRSSAEGASFYTARSIAKYYPNPPPMMVKLDGSIIDPAIFSALLLTDIESAEVIRTTGQMDMTTGAREVLYLISRKHSGTAIKPSTPDVITYQSNGLYKAREFYSPKYDKINESDSKPDLRTTIYWNPTIIVDKAVAEFEFFNADTRGTYRVTVEGIDADGNLGRIVYLYNVE
ncbi:TonB-dependent receptor [Mucilaginibacter sp. AW1-7]|uniref:TonB-dependent receptor n=1 Tax=Mucilaginibacter sp. AW1-7 TaxID=3349874 RepID=UPI003F73E632